MKSKVLLFLILVLTSCNFSKDSTNFEYIDFSFYVTNYGAFDKYSLKIYNNGKANLKKFDYKTNENNNYYFNLSVIQLDSLSQMAKIFLESKLDSIYSEGCDNCSNLCLIVKSKNRKKIVKHFGEPSFRDPSSLNNFAQFLNRLSKITCEKTDSIFSFESYITLPVIDTLEEKIEMSTDDLTFMTSNKNSN